MANIMIKPSAGMTMMPVKQAGGSDKPAGKDFGELLKGAMQEVNNNAIEAQTSAAGLISGQHANVHETMIAMEKSSLSFRLMTKLQNKVVDAYREIIRIQV